MEEVEIRGGCVSKGVLGMKGSAKVYMTKLLNP